MSMDDRKRAEEARVQGNAYYKDGDFDKAITLYKQAHNLDPQQAAALSNLAATYFELGDYAESNTYADRALSLLGDDTAAQKSRSRLLLRKLRALILLKRFDDAKTLTDSTSADLPDDPLWRRLVQAQAVRPTVHTDQMASPFKPMVGDFSHTEVVGDDKPTSLFDTSLLSQQGDRKDASFLFVNAGDARNVFATLLHLADPAINTGDMRFLFALADTNPHNSARLMVIMSMLGKLKDEKPEAATSELLATLFYTYISPTIPARLYTILQHHIQAAYDALETDELPDYLGAEPERAEAILEVLNFWLSKAQDQFPTSRVRQVLDDDLINATSEDLEFFPAKLKQEAKAFRETRHLRSGLASTDDGEWKTNVTLIADTPSRLQGLVFDPFKFGSLVSAIEVSDSTTLAELVSSWFIRIVGALRVLQDKVILTVRGLPAGLPPHNYRASNLAIAQRLYDRIHLADYPDLVGGTLFVYTYAVPFLRPGSTSYVSWKSSSYATAFKSWNDYDLEFLAIDPDRKGTIVRQLFGVRADIEVFAQDATSYLFDSTSISGYRRARSSGVVLSHKELMPRERLTTWLYRILLKTVLPHIAADANDDDVLSPFNLGIFVKLLDRLVSIGYPAHWLSDLIAELLSGTITTSARPPLSRPLRLKEVTTSITTRSLDVSFLEVELTGLLGSLPFGIVDENLQAIQPWRATFKELELHDSASSTYALLLSTPKPKDIDEQLQALTLSKRRAAQLLGSQLITTFSLTDATATFHAPITQQPEAEVSLLHVESWKELARSPASQVLSSRVS